MARLPRARRRRTVLWLALAATLAASCGGVTPPLAGWNVVLIVVDTLRADHLPFHGYPRNTAPQLSRWAEAGVVFRHAHSSSSHTAPATASLFTSLHPIQHGVLVGFHASKTRTLELKRIPEDAETLGELFEQSGYTTFAVTGNLSVSKLGGFDRGFRYFRAVRYPTAEQLNDWTLKWRGELKAARPYFLYLHYFDPHQPYHSRSPWFRDSDDPDVRTIESYDSEIAYVDQQIGRLQRALGWGERTLVVVTADHGEELRERGRLGHGATLFGEVIDVPLLLWGPRRWAGRVIEQHVSSLDLLPTLVELLGLRAEGAHEGRSLVPLLDGAAPRDDAPPVYAHLELGPRAKGPWARSLIQGDWKLILGPAGERSLYDLRRDPAERTNLAAGEPRVAQQLESRLQALEQRAAPRTPSSARVEISYEDEALLRELGYGE